MKMTFTFLGYRNTFLDFYQRNKVRNPRTRASNETTLYYKVTNAKINNTHD